MRLAKAIFINRAPFDNLELNFDNSNIFVLSGINGKGKTTVLSYIVDSFYELAKKAFRNEFEDKENKFYRVSATSFSMDKTKTSIVYLRFTENGENIDYIDIREKCSKDEYDTLLKVKDKIEYTSIESLLTQQSVVKYWNIEKVESIQKIFNNSLNTYFPAYRYETPNYLNNPYKIKLKFKTESDFSGYLSNPIENITTIGEIMNWTMDIVLDAELYKNSTGKIWDQINEIFNCFLYPKIMTDIRLGIGPRNNGSQRIAVVNKSTDEILYPSIFNMSSGELSLISLFVELVKQSDKIAKTNFEVSGIVLIDEIDKHLHIKLQKEILPKLLLMFPNVQFVITSHSPFFTLGLSENSINHKIFDFDNNGILCVAQNNDLFNEVYKLMINENNRFADKYNNLKNEIEKSTKPLIITEGKTDWKHLKSAMKALNINDIDIEFFENEDAMGDITLLSLLENYAKIPQIRKIVGIFDRDSESEDIKNLVNISQFKNLGNNVFAFAIPIAHENLYGKFSSIEHYYIRDNLLKLDNDNRRIFLGEEFYGSGRSKDKKYDTKTSKIQNKVKKNGIIDEKVYEDSDLKMENSIALSKDDFATYIYDYYVRNNKTNEYAKDFDFSEFNKIFDIIREIIKL